MADPTPVRVRDRFATQRDRADRNRSFPIVMRGYDRGRRRRLRPGGAQLVSELEAARPASPSCSGRSRRSARRPPSILQRAHETADEIAARSRAQAEGRIQRAEREADLLRQQADAYSEQIVVDTRLLWEERQRLIEDIRQLADDVLATAEDALERVALPQMLAEPRRWTPSRTPRATDPPTSEVELDVLPGGARHEDGAPERSGATA